MSRVVVTVRWLYGDEQTETFEGTVRSVRAELLMRFPFARLDAQPDTSLEAVVAALDRLQTFEVELILSDVVRAS